MNVGAFLLQPLLSAALTEVLKWLTETVGPEWSALASKIVAYGFNTLLGSLSNLHLPIDLGPVLNPLQPWLVGLVTTLGSQLLHDIASAIAKYQGVSIPTAKLSVTVAKKP